MTPLETVALYYDAWKNKHGDLTNVRSPMTSHSPAQSRASRPPIPDLGRMTSADLLEVGDGSVFRSFGLPRTIPAN